MKVFVLLLVAITLSAAGELLLKYGMNRVGILFLDLARFGPALIRTFSSPYILLGLAIIFAGSIFWLSVISRVQLSYAYPMLSLGYVLVTVSSWLLLGEDVSLTRLAGVLIICFGIFVVSRS